MHLKDVFSSIQHARCFRVVLDLQDVLDAGFELHVVQVTRRPWRIYLRLRISRTREFIPRLQMVGCPCRFEVGSSRHCFFRLALVMPACQHPAMIAAYWYAQVTAMLLRFLRLGR